MIVLLLIIITFGSTYAYFSSRLSTNNSVGGASEKYEIIYNGGEEINGNIKMLSSHVGADNTTVSIAKGQDVNVDINATLYINITQISPELAVSGFKWEIYRVNGNNEILENSGNFAGKAATDEIAILTKALTTTLTSYKVYFWLDGASVGNEISGKTFKCYIDARTDNLTGIVSN